MRRAICILFTGLLFLPGCRKDKVIPTSGTETIDNTIYQDVSFYSLGFSFSQAKKISNRAVPGPDITLYLNSDNPNAKRLTFQVDNFKPSFFKLGDFPDESSAIAAFNGLITVSVSQWTDMADPVNVNQVWVYRTGSDQYAKIRIVSTKNEIRNDLPFGECTFQWVFQPDGSLTFPVR